MRALSVVRFAVVTAVSGVLGACGAADARSDGDPYPAAEEQDTGRGTGGFSNVAPNPGGSSAAGGSLGAAPPLNGSGGASAGVVGASPGPSNPRGVLGPTEPVEPPVDPIVVNPFTIVQVRPPSHEMVVRPR